MNEKLETFLRADELDDLLSLATKADPLDLDSANAVKALVWQWTDMQAIANVLMYPALIPLEIRFETLLKGLQASIKSYLVVAAAVGLQRVAPSLSDLEKKPVIERLIEIIQFGPPVVAGRASVTLAGLNCAEYADRIVELLGHPDNAIKHNVLVALVNTVGLARARSLIETAFVERRLIRDGKLFAEAQLTKAELLFKDGKVDQATWYQSDLAAPLLTYIPNLKNYQN